MPTVMVLLFHSYSVYDNEMTCQIIIPTYKWALTEPMNRAEAHQTDSVVLHVVVAPPVPLPGHFGAAPQTADDDQREHGKAKDAGHDGDDNRFGGD